MLLFPMLVSGCSCFSLCRAAWYVSATICGFENGWCLFPCRMMRQCLHDPSTWQVVGKLLEAMPNASFKSGWVGENLLCGFLFEIWIYCSPKSINIDEPLKNSQFGAYWPFFQTYSELAAGKDWMNARDMMKWLSWWELGSVSWFTKNSP